MNPAHAGERAAHVVRQYVELKKNADVAAEFARNAAKEAEVEEKRLRLFVANNTEQLKAFGEALANLTEQTTWNDETGDKLPSWVEQEKPEPDPAADKQKCGGPVGPGCPEGPALVSVELNQMFQARHLAFDDETKIGLGGDDPGPSDRELGCDYTGQA